jgi:hypothetical protein
MMKLRIDMLAPGCDGRLSGNVAWVEITNTMEGELAEREYLVEAFYRRENGQPVIKKFNIVHNRLDGMWVLAERVMRKIHQLDEQEKVEEIRNFLDKVDKSDASEA